MKYDNNVETIDNEYMIEEPGLDLHNDNNYVPEDRTHEENNNTINHQGDEFG